MDLSPHSQDEDLIQGCLQGNRLAQKYLYQKYYGKMFGIPMRYTNGKEEAVEVLNSAFLQVFESLKVHERITNLPGWIARIVYRTSIDYVRSNTTYKKIMDFNSEEDNAVENKALGNMAAEEIYALIQQLPAASRTVFSMYSIEGYKHSEIADQLKIPIGTSKWHLSQARTILQTLIVKNNI